MNEESIRTWLKVAKKILSNNKRKQKKYSRIQSPNTSNILHLKHHKSRLYQINQLTQSTPPNYQTSPLLPRPLLKRQSQFGTKILVQLIESIATPPLQKLTNQREKLVNHLEEKEIKRANHSFETLSNSNHLSVEREISTRKEREANH